MHLMKLNPSPFERIKNGSKRVEIKLFDKKRQILKVNELIQFSNIENPKEKKLMRKIVRLKKSGSSYGQITDYLNRNRYKTKSGTKWTRGNVFGVLKSRMNENQVCFS